VQSGGRQQHLLGTKSKVLKSFFEIWVFGNVQSSPRSLSPPMSCPYVHASGEERAKGGRRAVDLSTNYLSSLSPPRSRGGRSRCHGLILKKENDEGDNDDNGTPPGAAPFFQLPPWARLSSGPCCHRSHTSSANKDDSAKPSRA
jgi:hypothetical protein